MNFSTLQGMKIPEGNVVQVAKDGVVLWKAGSDLVKVDLGNPVSQTRTTIDIDGDTYYSGTFDVSVGTILHCEIFEEGSNSLEDVTVKIHLNGTVVKSERFRGNGSQKITYDHTITTNTTITKEFSEYSKCNIYIVES